MAWSFDEQNDDDGNDKQNIKYDDDYFYRLDMAFLGRPSKLTKKELGLPAEQGCQ